MTIDAAAKRALGDLSRALGGRRISVIGAAALDYHLPALVRPTLDIDTCVELSVEDHALGNGIPSTWARDRHVPHRWHAASTLVDVLPASAELLERGSVEWPDGQIMNLLGIDLAMQDCAPIADDLPDNIRVASLRATFVCKVASWTDRPDERPQDLPDLALILEHYVEPEDPRIFDDPALDPERESDERSPFLLGRDLAAICGAGHTALLDGFLVRARNPADRLHHLLRVAGPSFWEREADALPRAIDALRTGLALT